MVAKRIPTRKSTTDFLVQLKINGSEIGCRAWYATELEVMFSELVTSNNTAAPLLFDSMVRLLRDRQLS